jgi:hypothetical protein
MTDASATESPAQPSTAPDGSTTRPSAHVATGGRCRAWMVDEPFADGQLVEDGHDPVPAELVGRADPVAKQDRGRRIRPRTDDDALGERLRAVDDSAQRPAPRDDDAAPRVLRRGSCTPLGAGTARARRRTTAPAPPRRGRRCVPDPPTTVLDDAACRPPADDEHVEAQCSGTQAGPTDQPGPGADSSSRSRRAKKRRSGSLSVSASAAR